MQEKSRDWRVAFQDNLCKAAKEFGEGKNKRQRLSMIQGQTGSFKGGKRGKFHRQKILGANRGNGIIQLVMTGEGGRTAKNRVGENLVERVLES